MYSNWRGGDGSPNVSGNGKSNAFISQSDGTNEWITASENEEHYIVCIFRIHSSLFKSQKLFET